jgi:hypothetical protein
MRFAALAIALIALLASRATIEKLAGPPQRSATRSVSVPLAGSTE